ncbi:hypothetical protein L523_4589 [Bordetella bronchiseptica MBORD731]|nr:hypothetical protein L523_4589 [Bordetella bronchiseptica MBORD731]
MGAPWRRGTGAAGALIASVNHDLPFPSRAGTSVLVLSMTTGASKPDREQEFLFAEGRSSLMAGRLFTSWRRRAGARR